jgi:hypothetical protein
MNLLQTRTLFRTTSGRFDLVNTDFSDNGADFYLNEGRKFLDRLDETQKSWASAFRFLEIGFYATSIQQCRAIKEVWLATLSARWQLEKMDFQDLVALYMTGLPSSRENGTPDYYSPIISRYVPESSGADDFEAFVGWVEIPSGSAHDYNSIVVNCPVSEKTLVEVKGLFYSAELVNDTDMNYWSVRHPLLLIMSAMRYIEIVNRNTQGVNDWNNSIATEMRQLGMDFVEEVIAEVSEIGD